MGRKLQRRDQETLRTGGAMSDPTINTLLEMGLRYIPRPIQRRRAMSKHTPTDCLCGHEAIVITIPYFQVWCSNQGLCARRGPRATTEQEAVEFWNEQIKAVNCHDDLLVTLNIILEETRRANGLPHFSEEQITFMAESIAKAGK